MREYEKPSMELKLYRARIYDNGKDGDDRIQVRIIPYMIEYEDSECGDLPRYPALFKGHVFNGYTERNPNPLTKKADEVFVLATNDWTYGYVVGYANMFYNCSSTPYQDSYGFMNIQSYLSTRGLDAIDYDSIVVDNWLNTDEGGYIEFHNFKTGDKYIINASGNCFAILSDRIYIRAGSPNGTKNGGNGNPFSTIVMTNTDVTIKTKNFSIDAEKISLGKHGHYLLGTVSSLATAYNGVNLQPIKDITV